MDENKMLDFDIDETLLEELKNTMGNEIDVAGLEELAMILSLPDEQFDIFSGLIIEELNKSLNDTKERARMQSELIGSGYDLEELVNTQEELMNAIDTELANILPPHKLDFIKTFITTLTSGLISLDNQMNLVSIPIELCDENAQLPKYAHETDGAMDIYATSDYTINPGETQLINTGIKVAIPVGYALLVQPRSGLSAKTKLRVANSPGLIDSGYRDEIKVIAENIEPKIKDIDYEFNEDGSIHIKSIEHGSSCSINRGDRIAQLRLVEIPKISWVPIEHVSEVVGDRLGGFGSTGK